MAARMLAMSTSSRSSGAQISTASWTGAQTSIPRSVARQHASRSISAPLACMGKLRSERGLGLSPTAHASRTRCAGAGEHGVVERSVGPAPERAVGLAVGAQQVARDDGGWPIRSARASASMPYWTASTQLEQLALRAVRCPWSRPPGLRRLASRTRDRGRRTDRPPACRRRRTAPPQCRILAATSPRRPRRNRAAA